MDAIVLAGGIPLPNEPLYSFTKGNSKAMLEISSKPMIQWVLDALCKSKSIENIVVVGLSEENNLRCEKKLFFISDKGGLIKNIQAGAQKVVALNKDAKYVLLVSADIPAITAEMVNWVINNVGGKNKDFFYNIIPREVMEKRYPGCRRTYLRFKDITFCGGDLHVMGLRMLMEEDNGFWKRLTDARKNFIKQAAMIGLDIVFLYIFRQMTIERAEAKMAKHLNITGEITVCPYAEVGMDVDKPLQLEIMRSDLKERQ